MEVLNTTSPRHSPAPVKDRPRKTKPSSKASNAFKDYLEMAVYSYKYNTGGARGGYFFRGEPMLTGFDPAGLGLELLEDLGPPDIHRRFFEGRSDGYRASEHAHFATAAVR